MTKESDSTKILSRSIFYYGDSLHLQCRVELHMCLQFVEVFMKSLSPAFQILKGLAGPC
jgi:hypothetical protein